MILIAEQGPDAGLQWTIAGPQATIGRDKTCDVPLQDERISHRHARLWQEGDLWWIEDLNSTNGTWVNDQQLTDPTRLQPGDRLRLGFTVFSISYEELPVGSGTGAHSPAPPAVIPAQERGSAAPNKRKQRRGDLVAGLIDCLIGLAALMLIAGAFLPWIRITVDVPFVGELTATPAGTQGQGTYTLIGGALSLTLALISLVVRGIVATRDDSSTAKRSRLFLRWSGLGHLLIASALLLLSAISLLRYYQSANREVFLGISLIDLFDFALDWLNLKLIPQIGLILTGFGMVLLLLEAATRLIVALLIEKPTAPTSPKQRTLILVLRREAQPGLEFAATNGFTLGRGEDNDIVIQDEMASRHHAEIRSGADGFVIIDRGSTNGVMVNNQRVAAPCLLRPGDQIQIGHTFFEVIGEANSEGVASFSGTASDQRWLWSLAAVGGLLFVAAIVGAILLLNSDQGEPSSANPIQEIATLIPEDLFGGEEPVLSPLSIPTISIPILESTPEPESQRPERTAPEDTSIIEIPISLPAVALPTIEMPIVLPDMSIRAIDMPIVLPDVTLPWIEMPGTFPIVTLPAFEMSDTLPAVTLPVVEMPVIVPNIILPEIEMPPLFP